jgi:hypothetical protein
MKYSRVLQLLGALMIVLSTRAGAQAIKPVVPRGDLLNLRVAPAACCVVTAIDLVKGVVSGRETATGYTFKFTVLPGIMSAQDSAKLVRGITINQKVWASLQGKGVKVVYDKPICCMIIEEADH